MDIKNMDIASLISRMVKFRSELVNSQSFAQTGFTESDKLRLASYINAATKFKAMIVAGPELDLPVTHPAPYKVELPGDIGEIENLDIQYFIRLFDASMNEMAGSQSANLANGMNKHDSSRFDVIVSKSKEFLESYIGGEEMPLDLPESAS